MDKKPQVVYELKNNNQSERMKKLHEMMKKKGSK